MLPTFETLHNFPVVVIEKEKETTSYFRIHDDASYELIHVCNEDQGRFMAYGVDNSKDVSEINDLLAAGIYSDNETFENQVKNLRNFIPNGL